MKKTTIIEIPAKKIVKKTPTSLQRKKAEHIDPDLCDRFYSIYTQSGMTNTEFISEIGVALYSYVTEIKNHVLEPSKNMIRNICNVFNLSADWLIFGIGDKYRKDTKRDEVSIMIENLENTIHLLKTKVLQSKKK
jgi:transcriptional regulator with XRE-family HTH domain